MMMDFRMTWPLASTVATWMPSLRNSSVLAGSCSDCALRAGRHLEVHVRIGAGQQAPLALSTFSCTSRVLVAGSMALAVESMRAL